MYSINLNHSPLVSTTRYKRFNYPDQVFNGRDTEHPVAFAAGPLIRVQFGWLSAMTAYHPIHTINKMKIIATQTISGWWYTYPSEKYMKVNWDDDIAKKWKNKNMFQTTNQNFI